MSIRPLVPLGAVLVAAGLSLARADQAAPAAAPTSTPAPATPPSPAMAEAGHLKSELDEIVAHTALSKGRLGVLVERVATGEVLYARDADELLNPASNTKLVTAATSLARLGPEYRFATDFACEGGLRAGTCRTLYIKGRGDPALYTERIYGIAGELVHRGLTKVGAIVVDDSYFDDVRWGPGWEQDHGDQPYLAPTGALSINHNAVAVYVTPAATSHGRAKISLEPESAYFKLVDNVRTVSPRARRRVIVHTDPDGDRETVVVSGRLPAGGRTEVFYRKIDDPPRYAGETFKAMLESRGVHVSGPVKEGTMPDDAPVVFTSYSPSLAEIVREMDKVSNNFVAEQLTKTVGAELKGPPGSWDKGVAADEDYLAELGIPKGSFVMKNGSGLNDTNRFSPAQLVRVLREVAKKSDFFPEFASSLGIAGRDGTVRSRMAGTDAEGRLRAKTGTLENVIALSGYVRLQGGELVAYSILVNDFPTSHGPIVAAVDRLGAAIAGGGVPDSEPTTPAHVAGPDELRARVATYENLARVADRRNLPFLRSALATERDPVLRAVVADAIYRSDPDGEVATLLDNVPQSADVFARLRAVGQELNLPTPLVSSLIDVAADGNPEAMDKLLLIAHDAKGDENTEPMLADGLQEIGRNAPDELFASLTHAVGPVKDDGLALLVRGIAATDEKGDHPFLARLKELPAPKDEPAGQVAPSMALYDRLEKALAELAKPPAATTATATTATASAPATTDATTANATRTAAATSSVPPPPAATTTKPETGAAPGG